MGQVQPGGGGGSAKIEQHREYLLHGGRYASCVHAGGLSCLMWIQYTTSKFCACQFILAHKTITQFTWTNCHDDNYVVS